MNIFNLKKQFFIFLTLLLGIFFLHILYKNTEGDPLSKSSYFFFSEIQTITSNFRNSISSLVKKYFFLLELNEKNKKLQRQNKEIKAQNQLFEEILKENERLKKLLHFPLNKNFKLLPAQIAGTDFLSKNELLTLNKGSLQGVKKFMGVLHPSGVVGHIFRVSPHSSQVLSLLSPLSSLPARNNRNRTRGLIEAYKPNLLIFNYIDRGSKEHKSIEIGDQIVTTKSDQFPAGFLVGTVFSMEHPSKNLNPSVYVKPAVSFSSLEEVLIVFNPKESPFSTPKIKREKRQHSLDSLEPKSRGQW